MASERNNASGEEGRLNLGQDLWRAALVTAHAALRGTAGTGAGLTGSNAGILTSDCKCRDQPQRLAAGTIRTLDDIRLAKNNLFKPRVTFIAAILENRHLLIVNQVES